MDISCPHCGAAYRVPDALLKPGKPLRCAACKGEWVPLPLPDAPVAAAPEPGAAPVAAAPQSVPPAPPPPTAERGARLAPEEPRPRRGPWLPLAWGASLAVVAAALAGAVVFRSEIAAAWPPFARVAAIIGG